MAMQEMREAGFRSGGQRGGGVGEGLRGRTGGGMGDDGDGPGGGSPGGLRLRFRRGVLPAGRAGRIAAAASLLGGVLLLAGAGYAGQRFLLGERAFVIAGSSSIEIEGNNHLTRAQLLSVFGEDVDRNVLTVPLAERRAELDQLPWVKDATVMRLLPNRLRVRIAERQPVAFVRQGRRIGLVDEGGVLLDMPSDGAAADAARYSFPVVTGVTADEPLSVRAARMRIFARFARELDASGEKISATLGEVDLSNPEDVKALIPDGPSGASEVLVHFGDADFLERYRKFEEQMPGWRQQYPKLASADMRYERQVVLEMQQGPPAAGPAVAGSGKPAGGAKMVGKGVGKPVRRAAVQR